MNYYVVNFHINCEKDFFQISKDLLIDAAGEHGFDSFEETVWGVKAYIQKIIFQPESIQQIIDEISLDNVTVSYDIEEVKEQNWNETWENEGFAPIDIDSKILVYDNRHPERLSQDSCQPIKIRIEATQAFGTGSHETTKMMISELSRLYLQGKRILDCGCGTGILGIAATLLGAKEVVAYDIDEWSVKNTAHNALLNNVDTIHCLHGTAQTLPSNLGFFDIVLANINRNILIGDMPVYSQLMDTDALLLLSGFYEEDIPILKECAAQYGLHAVAQAIVNHWACVVFQKSV